MAYLATQTAKYDYIIFLDDDLEFDGMSPEQGFEEFERFLESYRPAIGIPRCFDYNTKHSNIDAIPEPINRQGLENTSLHLQPVDWFDACFNAFRMDVFEQLLPYDPRYDPKSWYTSQFLLILKSNLLFKNRIIQNNRIRIKNKSLEDGTRYHYPRDVSIFGEAYIDFLERNRIDSINMSRVPVGYGLRQRLRQFLLWN